ncbi:hypothetical protein FIBSPDRAFT_877706 [Athelia psychrophila]|uniref:Uncharacterized protein n=1 Tax=Athelia psychrophila TaxID=1759441 RepID=A0A167VRL1_9AGAM|nr:hypothetical protein FIBSPDRAFT_877706 [Fibularhizoctonia sp. CBS 109695]
MLRAFFRCSRFPASISNSSSSRPCDNTTASTSPDTTYWSICFHEAKVPMVPRTLCIGIAKVYGVSVKWDMLDGRRAC